METTSVMLTTGIAEGDSAGARSWHQPAEATRVRMPERCNGTCDLAMTTSTAERNPVKARGAR